MQLSEKTAVVTGASRGLGRAVAQRFAREGARLVVISRRATDLEDLSRSIESNGGQCLPLSGDVSKPKEIQRIAQKVKESLDRADILINNAAIIGPAQFTEDFDHWQQTLQTNLLGVACCIHSFLPLLLEQSRPTVVNITSGLARMAFPRFAGYCTSKAGVEHLSKCLAEEYGNTGLRIACLDPGVMNTGMQAEIRGLGPEKLGTQLWNQFTAMHSANQLRDPNEVAELALAMAINIPQERNGSEFSLNDLQTLQSHV